MFKRILVLLDRQENVDAVLARAEKAARKLGCPVHLVCMIDVSPLTHCGAHGPCIDVSRYRAQVPSEHASAHRYLRSVAKTLSDRGLEVTYDVRPGLLAFELPAAVRPGDLVVTESQQCLELLNTQKAYRRTGQDVLRNARRPSFCR